MKQKLLTVYSGRKWADKVKNMSEAQTFAVYMRLMNAGKLK